MKRREITSDTYWYDTTATGKKWEPFCVKFVWCAVLVISLWRLFLEYIFFLLRHLFWEHLGTPLSFPHVIFLFDSRLFKFQKKCWSVGVLFPTLVINYPSHLNKLSVFTCEFKIISEWYMAGADIWFLLESSARCLTSSR